MIVKNRIKKHAEFQKVISEGSLERGNSFYLYSLSNAFGYTRIGISVPKKSGNAVIRNRIKRQIRAICALNNNYTKSLDLVLIVRKNYNINDFESTKDELLNLFEKLGK